MNQLNSFIFNSDRTGPARTAVYLALWVVTSLVAIDVLINIVFAYPNDPKILQPSRLQSYFDYGRSQEGKLRRMTRADKSQTAPITLAGWYDPLEIKEPAVLPNSKIITFYGMSHAVNLAHALGRVSKRYDPRVVGAPGATANWAYGAYLRDRGGGISRIVVLAFMSGNLPMINTMSAMTWNTDFAMPYTSDRFLLDNGELKIVPPPYASFDEYVQTFYDQKKWSDGIRLFAKYDTMYDPFIVRASSLDHSAFFRLLRRAYAQRVTREAKHAVLDNKGYNPLSNEIRIAQKIAQEFAIDARRNGMVPIIFLANLFGDSDYLYQALKPTLEHDKIPYLSSHTIASPNDSRKYLSDSHFTTEIDDEMARALVSIIDKLSD